MEVAGCIGITFLVVFCVVFGFWLVFLGAFRSGLYGCFPLVYMALCCGFLVVDVNACWFGLGFH